MKFYLICCCVIASADLIGYFLIASAEDCCDCDGPRNGRMNRFNSPDPLPTEEPPTGGSTTSSAINRLQYVELPALNDSTINTDRRIVRQNESITIHYNEAAFGSEKLEVFLEVKNENRVSAYFETSSDGKCTFESALRLDFNKFGTCTYYIWRQDDSSLKRDGCKTLQQQKSFYPGNRKYFSEQSSTCAEQEIDIDYKCLNTPLRGICLDGKRPCEEYKQPYTGNYMAKVIISPPATWTNCSQMDIHFKFPVKLYDPNATTSEV